MADFEPHPYVMPAVASFSMSASNGELLSSTKSAEPRSVNPRARTRNAAIVAREFGIPAVLKVGRATSLLEDGEIIAVDGHAGSVVRLSTVGVQS